MATRHPPPQGGMGTHKNTVNTLALTREEGAPATMETNPQYSGFKEAIRRWGTGTETALTRDLKWQKEVAGDAQRINQFKEVVGGLQDFRTYLFMKPGSAFATVLHSPMKFIAISDATQHLQGKFVAFVGDRSARNDPTPIVLPPQKSWGWETRRYRLMPWHWQHTMNRTPFARENRGRQTKPPPGNGHQ